MQGNSHGIPMRTMQAAMILASLLLLALPCQAGQNFSSTAQWQEETPQAHIERGLALMVQGNYDGGFKALFGKHHRKDSLEKLKFEVYRLAKKSGAPRGFERILQQKAGTFVTRYRYLLLFDAKPIVFDFYFYKKERGWTLLHIHYNMDIRKAFAQ